MTNNNKPSELSEGLTKNEKRVLIGESTFLSFGFVVTIILAVVFTVRIDGKADANAKSVNEIVKNQDSFSSQVLTKMDSFILEMQKINTRLSRIEGQLDKRRE